MEKIVSAEDVQSIMSKLELVESINNADNWLKISGEPIRFAQPADAFSTELIRMIPEFYSWLRAFANNGDQEVLKKLREDLKTYLGQKESILAYHLKSSKISNLLENDDA